MRQYTRKLNGLIQRLRVFVAGILKHVHSEDSRCQKREVQLEPGIDHSV